MLWRVLLMQVLSLRTQLGREQTEHEKTSKQLTVLQQDIARSVFHLPLDEMHTVWKLASLFSAW